MVLYTLEGKTSSGHWAAGETKSSTSASFHMRSLILAVLHRANSLLAMGPETGQRGCVSPEGRTMSSYRIQQSAEHRPPASCANLLLRTPCVCPPYLLTSSAQTSTLPVHVVDKSAFRSMKWSLLSWKTPHYLYLWPHNRLFWPWSLEEKLKMGYCS